MSVAQPLPIGFFVFLETPAIGFAKITCMFWVVDTNRCVGVYIM